MSVSHPAPQQKEPGARAALGSASGTSAGGADSNTSRASLMHAFDRFAGAATRQAGSATAFVLAVAVVVAWAVTGPIFDYSETWQLIINTGTTIVTFLMVFLIQQSQNKDSVAVHLKLNELLASHRSASNRLVAIEDLDEEELHQLVDFYRHLATLAKDEGGVKRTHSLDEADMNDAEKDRAVDQRDERRAGQAAREDAREQAQGGG